MFSYLNLAQPASPARAACAAQPTSVRAACVAQPTTVHAACAARPVASRPGGSRARNPRGEGEPDPLSNPT